MKLISWNIDSLNAALTGISKRAQESRRVLEEIKKQDCDILALQETKLRSTGPTPEQLDQLNKLFPDYKLVWNSSSGQARKSYAGVAFLYKEGLNPIVNKPILHLPDTLDDEGRLLTLEFENFYVTQVYTPNSGTNLERLDLRHLWDQKYADYLHELDREKPVIACGDYNVAYTALDLKHPERSEHSAGYVKVERTDFDNLLKSGFIDSFRFMHPQAQEYSWWDQRISVSKLYNLGWRIDYFLVSDRIKNNIEKATILDTFARKDHAPILLEIKTSNFPTV